jgi:signal transduction histidine kinase
VSQPESIFVPDLISALLRPLERDLAARSVRIVRQVDRTAPEVVADRASIERMIATLLAEAAASTSDGGRVRVCLKHNRVALMLSVKDQGRGLTPEQRDALFDPAARPRRDGAPLSLAECRDLATSIGGNLFVNSTPGKGSTFYLTLPPPRAS